MPASSAASGSQTATLDTDHTLTTTTAPSGGAIYQLRVDVAALATGESLRLRIRTKARNGDTQRDLYTMESANAQTSGLLDSPAVAVLGGEDIVAILRQSGGTGRAFPWILMRLDA